MNVRVSTVADDHHVAALGYTTHTLRLDVVLYRAKQARSMRLMDLAGDHGKT